MNRASGIRGTVTKDLTFMSSETQKGKKKHGAKKVLEEILAEVFPKLVKHINLWIQNAEQIPNRISQKKKNQDTS